MKIKLLTLVSLSMLLASCGQDDTLDNVTVENGKVQTTGNNAARGFGLTDIKFIKETVAHPQRLDVGQSISLQHGDYNYRLTMQDDSNLVLYREKPGFTEALWNTNTHRTSGTPWLIAQNDGNLVIYNNGNPLWHSDSTINGTVSNPHIKFQLYSRSGAAIPTGYRIKIILGGNNEERKVIKDVDFY